MEWKGEEAVVVRVDERQEVGKIRKAGWWNTGCSCHLDEGHPTTHRQGSPNDDQVAADVAVARAESGPFHPCLSSLAEEEEEVCWFGFPSRYP